MSSRGKAEASPYLVRKCLTRPSHQRPQGKWALGAGKGIEEEAGPRNGRGFKSSQHPKSRLPSDNAKKVARGQGMTEQEAQDGELR